MVYLVTHLLSKRDDYRFMKKFKIYFLIVLSFIIFVGCTSQASKKEDSTNVLEITENQEALLLEYLDTKTNNIAYSKDAAMFSAFKILGTDKNKVYIWLVKIEYLESQDKSNSLEARQAVHIPVSLHVKEDATGFSIISHEFPRDGIYYGKDVGKIFPPNIVKQIAAISGNPEIQSELIEVTRIRAEEKSKFRGRG